MDIIKAMSLGAFEHWVKPLEADVFEGGLKRALTGAGSPADGYSRAMPPGAQIAFTDCATASKVARTDRPPAMRPATVRA